MKSVGLLCIASLLVGFGVFACFETRTIPGITSTSVTTGNPTGVIISFKQDSLPVKLSGHADIFAATQIPVPGFQPKPLFSLPFTQTEKITLDSHFFLLLADSLWPKSSVEGDSIFRFNVVVSGESTGTILDGLGWKKRSGSFSPNANGWDSTKENGEVAVNAVQMPLIDYHTSVDTLIASMSPAWDYYLFIYGTKYYSKNDNNNFEILNLPAGKYEAFLLPLPGKNHISSGIDSTTIFRITTPVYTDKDSIVIGPIKERISLPDSLKIK